MLTQAPEEVWEKPGDERPHPRPEVNKEEAWEAGVSGQALTPVTTDTSSGPLQCWVVGGLRGLPTLQSPKTTGVASSKPASSQAT